MQYNEQESSQDEITIGEEQYEENDTEQSVDNDKGSLLLEAEKKYTLFEEQCCDILDPNRNNELELMKSLGLPTMLINSYADMETEEDEVCY